MRCVAEWFHAARARETVSTCALHAVADAQPPGLQLALVAEDFGLDFLRVVDDERAAGRDELAAVADLPARLGVERRAVEHDDRVLAGEDLFGLRAVLVERDHARLRGSRCS